MDRILVVSDGRRGIENQALGLAEAVARRVDSAPEIRVHALNPRPSFAALPPSVQLAFRKDYGLADAELIIGCGRQAIAPLLGLRRLGKPGFIIYVQDPKVDPSRFDLVVAPDHDNLHSPFVESMIGAPNRITRDRIIGETLAHSADLAQYSMPRAMIAIGGPSKTHSLDKAIIDIHMKAARDLIHDGYSLLVTTSRRTPEDVVQTWQDFSHTEDKIWLHTADSRGPNPYFAFLGGADILLITEDSTNMLTEACSTGKPVYRLPMAGSGGKFDRLYQSLETRCNLARWGQAGTPAPYDALRETDRVAERIIARYKDS